MRNIKRMFLISVLVLSGYHQNSCSAEEQRGLEKSVVMIRAASQEYDYTTPWVEGSISQGIGSGFVISGRRILTNAHNVSNAKYIEVKKESSAKRYRSMVAFVGHDCDLAILTIDDANFFDDTVSLELAGIPKVNTTVSTYGFPVGGNRISVTKGIVSRIEMEAYAHTGADSHLVIQTDAAINSGNSGGPVIQEGKVVGVAFQGMRQAENIGYLIPTTVIKHFLKDIEDGKYDGFGSLGARMYPGLHNHGYKSYLKVPASEEGTVIISTLMHSSVEPVLQAGDVITKVDDYKVDNDGMVEIYGLRLNMGEVVETKQIGEIVELTFYRGGEQMKKTVKVALDRPILEYARQYDVAPSYVCYAGLTFVEVTRNFLESWGQDWLTDMPFYLRYLFYNSMELNTERERKQYVVLSEIMPDRINSYADGFKDKVVEKINGIAIYSLGDVYEAFKKPAGGFHVLEFMGSKSPLIIDAEKASKKQPEILKKYDIPSEARLEAKI